MAACGSPVAEGESFIWTWPRGAADAKLGARCCRRTKSDQIPHPQKDFEAIQTGTAFQFSAGSHVMLYNAL